jgi:hypothetical protein
MIFTRTKHDFISGSYTESRTELLQRVFCTQIVNPLEWCKFDYGNL